MRGPAFRFDAGRCTGCRACELACSIENDLPWGDSWRGVHDFNPAHAPGLPSYHLSLACNHCDDAPCMSCCPALAYRRDGATGAVLIEAELCIGCRYCEWVCPFEAPRFDEKAGTMTKCTLCEPRLRAGMEPACVSICPTDALGTTDRKSGSEAGERWIDGFPRTDCGPAIRFAPLRGDGPEIARAPAALAASLLASLIESRPESRTGGVSITLRREWPLAVFTLGAAILVAWIAGAASRGLPASPWQFLIACAVLMGLSATHLGKPLRAWRAVLNVRGSWLSREVALFGAFAAAGFLVLYLEVESVWLLRGTLTLGFALLFAMDRVYDFADRRGGSFTHSADALYTGVFLTWIFLAGPLYVTLFAGLKGFLYVVRKIAFARQGGNWRPLLSALRLAGLATSLLIWRENSPQLRGLILAGVLLGEAVDRAEFYMELTVPGPTREMAAAFARRLAECTRVDF